MSKVFIVIPIFNEDEVISSVVKGIHKKGFRQVIVVDDGSYDRSYERAKTAGATVLRHSLNRGKGAAIKTGIEAAKILGANIVVTMDGDGQHDPADIKKMINKIEKGYHVVLGSRNLQSRKMPVIKSIYNQLGNFFVWTIHGLWVKDSQSGFRAYSKKALSLIDTRTDRYEYESEVIREIGRHDLKYVEVPINVLYTNYSKKKKTKQGLVNGVKTLIRMVISQ